MSGGLAAEILALCRAKGVRVATAESCTGGMVAAAITDLAGSSDAFDRGFVTYSNSAKTDLLGVRGETLDQFGAVSAQTAEEMAQGALARSAAATAVSVTGIAGPGGGTSAKPVGLVWFATAARSGEVQSLSRNFAGMDRAQVRAAATRQALRLLVDRLAALGG